MEKLTDDERIERIKMVVEYYCNTPDASVRSTVEHFKSMGISISVATVSSYLHEYKRLFNQNLDVESTINSRKEVTYKDPEIRERILKEAKMVKEGYTIENIALILEEDYWTVYRDISVRLKKIDEELYNDISIILTNNSLANLKRK